MTTVLYLSWQIGSRIAAILLGFLSLGLSLNLMENGTKILETHSTGELALYAVLRAPLILVLIMPLGVLVGTALAFLTMALRNELVVLRAAGCNTVRILLMLVPLALAFGGAQSFLAAHLAPAAEQALVERFPEMYKVRGIDREIWLRDWRGVIRIGRSMPEAAELRDVSIYQIGTRGELSQRIDAGIARHSRDGWMLEDVTMHPANEVKRQVAELAWETRLTPASILGAAHRSGMVDTSEARQILAGALPAGRGTPYYSVQLWRSYSAYVVPLVMVLFGALASFGLSRGGGGGTRVALGLTGGAVFVLIDGVFTSLGEVGAMGAAWAAFLAPGLFFVIGLWSIIVVEE